MSTKLFLFALTAFFSLSHFAHAGVMLYVSFGENALPVVSDEQALQQTLDPGNSSSVTANIYLHLTDQSAAMYGYRFSVRYNSLALGLSLDTPTSLASFQALQNQVRQDLRDATNPDFFADDFPFTAGFGAPVSPSNVSDVLEIRRFNGYMDDSETTDNRFFKVATITFSVLNPALLTPGTQLVQPGKFDVKLANEPPFSPNDVNLDEFLGVNSKGQPIVLEFLGSSGGTVTPVASVPEPASFVVLGLLGVFVVARRKARTNKSTSCECAVTMQ